MRPTALRVQVAVKTLRTAAVAALVGAAAAARVRRQADIRRELAASDSPSGLALADQPGQSLSLKSSARTSPLSVDAAELARVRQMDAKTGHVLSVISARTRRDIKTRCLWPTWRH